MLVDTNDVQPWRKRLQRRVNVRVSTLLTVITKKKKFLLTKRQIFLTKKNSIIPIFLTSTKNFSFNMNRENRILNKDDNKINKRIIKKKETKPLEWRVKNKNNQNLSFISLLRERQSNEEEEEEERI